MSHSSYLPIASSEKSSIAESEDLAVTEGLLTSASDFKRNRNLRTKILHLLPDNQTVLLATLTVVLCALSYMGAPVKKDISPELKLVQYHGPLGYPSPFFGEPSDEIDSVWEPYVGQPFFSITEEELLAIGDSPDAAVRLPEKFGGGYYATTEFQHKMHCLNFVRKSLFFNHEYYSQRQDIYRDGPAITRTHLEHCLEIFRQDVMCSADPGVITSTWVVGRDAPYPNFNVWKVCRSWEDVFEWSLEKGRDNIIHDWKDLWVNGSAVWEDPPYPSHYTNLPSWSG